MSSPCKIYRVWGGVARRSGARAYGGELARKRAQTDPPTRTPSLWAIPAPPACVAGGVPPLRRRAGGPPPALPFLAGKAEGGRFYLPPLPGEDNA